MLIIRKKTSIELYNLKEDIKEQDNLASGNPEKVNELLELMVQSRAESKYFEFKN